MAGSSYGTIYRISTWGESHGPGLGVVIDGCPAGLDLCQQDIQDYLDRRKPGQSAYTTARAEGDQVEILSGIFEGKTTGTPISLLVRNQDQHSKDYSNIADCYRPGHADFTFDAKYGFRDYRGGGRSSGRETIGRVAGGAVAAKILKSMGIELLTYAKAIGPISVDMSKFDVNEIANNPFYMPDSEAAIDASTYLDDCRKNQDSAGGIVECRVSGLPAGLGDPVFEKLDANLAKAIFSIGAVKGFEIGEGFRAAGLQGSENNDGFTCDNGKIKTSTNHCGGILGGMSTGGDLVFRAAFKPTPSISQAQATVYQDGSPKELVISGRHDPIIVPRAVVVVEAMAAMTILDSLLLNMGARLDRIQDFYK